MSRCILLVEDDPADRRLMSHLLRPLPDLTLVEQDSCAATLAALEAGTVPTPDLVLLDLYLPGMDGVGFLKAMRASAALRTCVVLVLSVSQRPEDVMAAYRAGANAFIAKPDDLAGLRALARSIDEFWLRECRRVSPPSL